MFRGKKDHSMEMVTQDRTVLIQAENDMKLHEWIRTIQTIAQVHVQRDVYKEKNFILSEYYRHLVITSGKSLVRSVCRLTGVTKAIILAAAGKLKLSKVSNVDGYQINVDNDLLGNTLTQALSALLKVLNNVYDVPIRKDMDSTLERLRKATQDMNTHGIGTQNESALKSVILQIVQEIDTILNLPIPTPKIEVLFIINQLSNKMRLYAESKTNEERIREGQFLQQFVVEFPKVIEKVTYIMTDMTYVTPIRERTKFVPRVLRDVISLVKSAKFYTTSQTYASNASKTLFFVLNQIREVIKSAYPYEERESEFPAVGPQEAQFTIQSETEFEKILEEHEFSHDFMFDDDYIPPHPPEYEDEDFIPPPPPEEDDVEGLEEGVMILHEFQRPPVVETDPSGPQPLSNDSMEPPQQEEQPVEEMSVLFELDALLVDSKKRNSMPFPSKSPMVLTPSPGSITKKRGISIRTPTSPMSIHSGLLSHHGTPHFGTPTMDSPLNNFHGSPISTNSVLSQEGSVLSDKDVVDELDALLINHTS